MLAKNAFMSTSATARGQRTRKRQESLTALLARRADPESRGGRKCSTAKVGTPSGRPLAALRVVNSRRARALKDATTLSPSGYFV
jgi:hypothetical protein